MGNPGPRESEGDLDDAAELSPVLGMTGKRLLSLRFIGGGLGFSNDELSLYVN